MPINIDPIFPGTPQIWAVQISTANTNRDGTGTLGTLATGATTGSRVDKVIAIGTGTTANGVIRLFLDNGSTKFLIKELIVTGVTPSVTVEVNHIEFFYTDGTPVCMLHDNTWILKCSTNNAETWNVIGIGGDY